MQTASATGAAQTKRMLHMELHVQEREVWEIGDGVLRIAFLTLEETEMSVGLGCSTSA